MKILIIEDEQPAARRLMNLIKEIKPETELAGPLESIDDALEYLQTHGEPDLYMMDIQLADGLSFEIFEHYPLSKPVIFATAFDEYAIRAFKLNSVDYLLKPLEKEALRHALNKYEKQQLATPDFRKLIESLAPKQYKSRFLLKKGERFIPVPIERVAYFQASGKMVLLITHDKESYVLDETLDQLEKELDPERFYRANRSFIVSVPSVKEVRVSFNGKLKLFLSPSPGEEEISISRDKANAFKLWLGA